MLSMKSADLQKVAGDPLTSEIHYLLLALSDFEEFLRGGIKGQAGILLRQDWEHIRNRFLKVNSLINSTYNSSGQYPPVPETGALDIRG